MSCLRLLAVLALFALAAQAQDVEMASAAAAPSADIASVTGISAAAAEAIVAADPQFSLSSTGFVVAACNGAEPDHDHDHGLDVGVQNVGASPDAGDPDMSQAFTLQSKPAAKAKIYLNFNGGT